MIPPPLEAGAILTALDRHGVVYVLIGGLGAALHGSPLATDDIDITPEGGRANLVRLAACLREIEAKLRPAGAEEGVEFPLDERSFDAFTAMALTTKHGWLDVCLRPDGTGGYADLAQGAERYEVAGLAIQVASLDDIIRSKRAAGRNKDLAQLPLLRELREARARRTH